MIKKPIYLDYNATTPTDPRVVDAMLPYFSDNFGNASSRDHSFGWEAAEAVAYAREQIARLIGARPKDMIFTSGATEAINLALKGMAFSNNFKGNHIITSRTEHEAVLDTCRYLEQNGYRVTYLDVNDLGHIDPDELESEINSETMSIALMYANNETGLIHPVKEIGEIAKKYHIPFLCDATQAVGKIPVCVAEENIDLLVCSSHKMYGPKGVGVLYLNKEIKSKISAQIHGGKHERGFRSGTLNVPGIVGFGKAAEICAKEMETEARHLKELRDLMENELLAVTGITVNGDTGNRLPHVSNITVEGVEGERFILSLAKDIAVSRGSACSGNVHTPSHVLKAMGLSDKCAGSALRISLGRFTSKEEVRYAANKICGAIAEKRKTQEVIDNQ